MKRLYTVGLLPAILGLVACQKSNSTSQMPKDKIDSIRIDTLIQKNDTVSSPPFPQSIPSSSASCPALPIYGDSLVYIQPTNGQDMILNPVNNPGPGTYYSWPAGMIIDRNTGAIDITKSQTGMKYAIGYVPNGTNDTCMSTLILGGAAYFDSVYVVSGGVKAVPYFDADPAGGNTCGGGSGTGSGCKFDMNGAAEAAGVYVNNSSGEIDLDKTLNGQGNKGGVFGASPVDGQVATASIYYQLKHGSNNAPQEIDVEFIYYHSASSIPGNLLNTVDSRLNNALNGLLISTTSTVRPPLIVIVRGL